MRLGLFLGYQTAWSTPADHLAFSREAERLGYSVAWTAEAVGSDAPSVLAWIAGQTRRIGLGTAVMQIPARTPAMTAMTAATLDALSGGRLRLGLGISAWHVTEGWYGVPFERPLARTREYVEIVRMALEHKELRYSGDFYQLPLANGLGTALRLNPAPVRDGIPIYLGVGGPKNLELAGGIADGWLGLFFSPEFAPEQLAPIAAGRAKIGKTLDGFDIAANVPVVIGDDVEKCADILRWNTALYLGGMGSRKANFYNQLATRMGYGDDAEKILELYLSGRHQDAAAAIPFEFIDRTALLGPIERIADRLQDYASAGVTTLSVMLFSDRETGIQTLRAVAEALDLSGVGE